LIVFPASANKTLSAKPVKVDDTVENRGNGMIVPLSRGHNRTPVTPPKARRLPEGGSTVIETLYRKRICPHTFDIDQCCAAMPAPGLGRLKDALAEA
jgi:hypothetical protein